MHARPQPVDDSSHLTARDGRQLRQRDRSRLPAPQRRVDQVDAGGGDRDPHLPRPRLEVGKIVQHQVRSAGPNSWSWIAFMAPVNEFNLT